MDDLKALPTYLAQYEEHDIALLSQQLYKPMRELRVDCQKSGATLVRIAEDAKPRKFGLSDTEADGFCMAWLAFRAREFEAEQAEKCRLKEMQAQAFAIADAYPAIIITKKDQEMEAWDVHLAEIDFSHAGIVYGSDKLLCRVQQAKAAYDHDAAIKASVEKAHAIGAKIEGLIIEKHPTQAYYHVTLHSHKRMWTAPESLLKTVKEVCSTYLNDLLAKHADIHVVETDQRTADQKKIWTVSRDDFESVQCIGMAEVLHAVEQLVSQEQVANS